MFRSARTPTNCMTRAIISWSVIIAATSHVPAAFAQSDGPPSVYAPLEYLVGSWKGQAVPKERNAKSFRGWPEVHTWAWIFQKGKPTGMKLTIQGGKTLVEGTLIHDPSTNHFRLEAKSPSPSQPLVFEGNLDTSGKQLELTQVHKAEARGDATTLRILLRPNADFIRYTMSIDRKDATDTQFTRTAEVGLTKEGESFAAGSSASERPKCVVTGGAAAMTMSYQGVTYPICCTGCRDEFNENPEKYIKKAKLLAASATSSKPTSATPAPSGVSRFDDAFSSDVTTSPSTAKKSPAANMTPAASTTPNPAETPTIKPTNTKPAASATAARAATLLRLGQNLEKNRNPTAALKYYRQITKDFPTTPAAKTAKDRIKALEPN
jgi:YHS domain-containing protein